MAHTKATVRKRAMMGVKTIPQPCPPRMGQKGGKTPKISIKNLAKPTGKKTRVRANHSPEDSDWELRHLVQSIQKDQKTTELLIPKNAIFKSGKGGNLMRACLAPHSGKCYLGPLGLFDSPHGGHKLMHNTCQVCNHFAQAHAVGKEDKRRRFKISSYFLNYYLAMVVEHCFKIVVEV